MLVSVLESLELNLKELLKEKLGIKHVITQQLVGNLQVNQVIRLIPGYSDQQPG